jgi:glycosyltransferase involved in cell wall biosynthesis
MIPTYNCARFLDKTLQSVLDALPPSDIEIVVVDDCSTADDPEAVVARVGAGRVRFSRNEKNLGATATFNRCLTLARGHFVHILHGDDAVMPGFYAQVERALAGAPDAGACACRAVRIDEDGRQIAVDGPLAEAQATSQALFRRNTLTAPAVVVRREVVERVGGFHPDLVHSADWDLWKRIALVSRIIVVDEPLFLYRMHSGQDTSRLVKTATNTRDAARAIALSRAYTDDPKLLGALPEARLGVAVNAVKTAARFALSRDFQACRAQLRVARDLISRRSLFP